MANRIYKRSPKTITYEVENEAFGSDTATLKQERAASESGNEVIL